MTETTHGNLLVVNGVGVLITGEAAVGKSECALDLISRGHRLVADDVVLIDRIGNTLTGKAPDRFSGLMEIRDIGILDVRKVFSRDAFAVESEIDLCVELKRNDDGEAKARIGADRSEIEILGHKLPHFVLRVEPGRNIALLIELAVKLTQTGACEAERELIIAHDAAIAARFVQ